MQKKKPGRPRLPDDERRDKTVRVRLTTEEFKACELSSKKQGVSLSRYFRESAIRNKTQ